MEEWYAITDRCHERTFNLDDDLRSLSSDWERELAALWRLEADVNNGAYLQFIWNWGHESYIYASQALKNIGATRMAEIIDTCQALVDEHIQTKCYRQFDHLEDELPQAVNQRTLDLSYAFMDYPEDMAELGLQCYRSFLEVPETK